MTAADTQSDILAYEHYKKNLAQIIAAFNDPTDAATCEALCREYITVCDRLTFLQKTKETV